MSKPKSQKRINELLFKVISAIAFLSVLFLGFESKANSENIDINSTNFPDATFRQYVSDEFDINNDGQLNQTEIENAKEIECLGKGISSVKGIEFLSGLTILDVRYNLIKTIDVSQNKKLEELLCDSNKITKINVSNNPNLKTLRVSYNEISQLNVSNNSLLEVLYCDNCRITDINLNKNKNLLVLNCSKNNMSSLNVRQNTKLQRLYCSGLGQTYLGSGAYALSGPGLTELDVSNNKELTHLSCSSNSLTKLNLDNNIDLLYLECGNNKITGLSLKNNNQLIEIGCACNELTRLDVSKNTALTEIVCNQNKLEKLDISNNTELIQLLCISNRLKGLNVKNNKNLRFIECDDNDMSQLDLRGNSVLNQCVRKGDYYQDYIKKGVDSYVLDGNMNYYGRGCSTAYLQVDSTVNILSEDVIELQSLALDYTELTMTVGETFKLNIIPSPANYNEYFDMFVWYSGDGSVATVTDDGEVKAVGEGSAWVSVQIGDVVTKEYYNAHCYVTVKEKDNNEEQVKAFVTRFYTLILNREPDETGINYWTQILLNKEQTGAQVAFGFVNSPEFTEEHPVNDTEFVKRMYAAFFDRDGGSDGEAWWLDYLNKGYTRNYVLAGFTNSDEFKDLCAQYGINQGSLPMDESMKNNPNPAPQPGPHVDGLNIDASNVDPAKLDEYIDRLYRLVLKREPEAEGKQYWREEIIKGNPYNASTAAEIGFFNSPEYLAMNKTDEEFIMDCYLVFLNREAEESGFEYWKEKFRTGEYDRQKLIEVGVGHSNEFKEILTSYGFRILE